MNKGNLPATSLGFVIDAIEEMQERTIISDYAIGGAVAAILHAEPVSTVDLDIFFFLTERPQGLILSMEKIYEFAREKEFEFDQDYISIHGWLVQFVEASHDALWAEAIQTAQENIIDDRAVRVMDAEHLAAMWIQAGRRKDIRKIEMFDEAGIMNSDVLRDILFKFNLIEKWRNHQLDFTNEYRY